MNINNPFFSRIVQALALFFCALAVIIPRKIWFFCGGSLGWFCHLILKKHRRYALKNIQYALGDSFSQQKQKDIVKKSFILLGISIFEGLRCPSYTTSSLEKNEKYIDFEGWEHFETAKRTGKGILLLSAHFGLFELANLYYAKKTGRKLNFIMRRFDNQHLEKVITAHSKRLGVKHLHKQNGLRPAMRNIIKGEDLVIFPDQCSNLKEGINSTIFGRPSITLSLLPALAMKLGSPILPMFIFRQDDLLHHKIIFFPPIIAQQGDSLEELTQQQNDAIEKAIRMKPEQWLWVHRRWKEDNPELYKQ